MAAQTYNLSFSGYWLDRNKESIDSSSGVYCVYACTSNPNKTVSIRKLIYIGEASNVRERLREHEKYADWKSHLKPGETLCFSFAAVEVYSRERCEAAMINKHKPPENIEYKNTFPFDKTTMILSGRTALLHTNFTVERS